MDEKIFGLSISQWLPCPLAFWNLLFAMEILINLNDSLFVYFLLLLSSCIKYALNWHRHY